MTSDHVATAALVLVLVAVPLLAWWLHRRRLEAVRRWCTGVGWTFVGSDRSLTRRWSGTPFGVGRSRQVRELVVGTYGGRPAMSFEYRYTTSDGKNTTTHRFHVVALRMPAYLPTLELTPGHALQRLAARLGAQDIEFESHAFNDAWRVVARDERFAHAVVHPRLMERLMRPDARRMSIRVEATDVLSWAPGTPRYDTIGPRLGVLSAVVDAVPRFVWLDHGYDPGS